MMETISKIYLGLDVHVASTVWYLVDETGQVKGHGKVPTTATGLEGQIARCQEHGGDAGAGGLGGQADVGEDAVDSYAYASKPSYFYGMG